MDLENPSERVPLSCTFKTRPVGHVPSAESRTACMFCRKSRTSSAERSLRCRYWLQATQALYRLLRAPRAMFRPSSSDVGLQALHPVSQCAITFHLRHEQQGRRSHDDWPIRSRGSQRGTTSHVQQNALMVPSRATRSMLPVPALFDVCHGSLRNGMPISVVQFPQRRCTNQTSCRTQLLQRLRPCRRRAVQGHTWVRRR